MTNITTYTQSFQTYISNLDQQWDSHLKSTKERLHREMTILNLQSKFTSLETAIHQRDYDQLEQTLTTLYEIKEYHVVKDGEFYLQ